MGTGGWAVRIFPRSEQVTLHSSHFSFYLWCPVFVSPTRVFLCVLVAQKNTVVLSFVTRLKIFYMVHRPGKLRLELG